MNLEEIKTYLGEDWTKTDSLIRSSLKSDISLLNSTNDAILKHSGKQLRPIIALLVARACSGGFTTADTISFAAASELLHNATLLHDDVADQSPERRGAPTVFSLLGGPASVLIGDFWLVKAMDRIQESVSHSENVTRIFSRTLSDLAEGEMLQLQKADNGDTMEEDYFKIIYGKTASLFLATATAAAISVGASLTMREAVNEYAVDLGIAFQIKDDIFDYSDDPSIGKPVGIDLKEKKITLPLLGALSQVSSEEASAIRRKICDIDSHEAYVAQVRQFVLEHGGIDYAVGRLNDFTGKAIIALKSLPDNRDRDYLRSLAEFVAKRSS